MRFKEQMQCPCGRFVRRSNISYHKKSKVHKKLVKDKVAKIVALIVLNSMIHQAHKSTDPNPGES